jgi:hypothetical protein
MENLDELKVMFINVTCASSIILGGYLMMEIRTYNVAYQQY